MKNFRKRLFSMVVALVLTLGMMGGSAMAVSAEEISSSMGTTTTVSSVVYMDQMDITYSEGETYVAEIRLSTREGFASYQLGINVPDFIEVKDVYIPGDLKISETDYFTWAQTEYGFNATFSSAEDRGGEFPILYVNFAIAYEGNFSGCFSIGGSIETLFTNTQGTLPVSFRFNNINVTSGKEEVKVMKGDVNFDNLVDLNDIIQIQQAIVSNKTFNFSEDQFYAADINNDGTINIMDCQYMQMYLVGKIDTLEGIGGGNTEDGDVYPMSLNVRDQYGNVIFQGQINAKKGATYREVFAPIFEKLQSGYNIVEYTNIQSDYYGNVSVESAEKLIVEGSDIVYVNVYIEQGEENSDNLYIYYMYKNGDEYVPVDYSDEYIGADESLYGFVKEKTYNNFGDYAELDGVYFDDEFKNPVTDEDAVNETTSVYAVIVNADITGKTYNLLEAEYTSDGMQKVTQVGTVIFTEEKATVTYGDEEFTASYGNMLGQVSIYKNDYAVLCLTLEGSDAYIELNFDGSNNEVTEEFTKVAGEYPVVITGAPVQMTLTLYNNGVWKIGYSGVTMMGNYEISENGVILYMYDSPQEFIYDAEQGGFVPNYNGGQGGGSVSGGMSYDVSKVYGEYSEIDADGNVSATLKLSEDGFVLTKNDTVVKGTEMYAMVMDTMGQVSLFVNENICYTYMVDATNSQLMLVSEVDATNAEVTEEFKALAGTYRFIVDGIDMGITYELRSNGTVICYNGGFVAMAGYTIVSENVVEVTGQQVTVDREAMVLIMNIGSGGNTGSDDNVSTGIAYGTYTYTDGYGVEYWVDLYEDGSFYIKNTNGDQASGNEVYAFSSQDLSLFVSDYECYHISIKSGSKELSYLGHLDYSDREVTQEYAKLAGVYVLDFQGMEAKFILHDNGVVVGYLNGAKDITVYVINDNGTITIDGMGSATIDVENKVITPIFDEVIESDKVVVNSNVA